jgi:hypothetical protein
MDQNINTGLCRHFGPNFLQTFYPTLKCTGDILGLNVRPLVSADIFCSSSLCSISTRLSAILIYYFFSLAVKMI